jgi:broad specificity phosphatase PhoE
MNNNDITTIDLLRHGELETKGLFCAMPDEPLSEEGWCSLLNATNGKKWDIIISSTSLRCSSFAKTLAEKIDPENFSLSNHLREMDFGQWLGLPTKEIWQQEHKKLSELWSNPDDFIAPNGESIKAFNSRVEKAMHHELKKHQGKSILIITHSGVIRSILAMALEISNKSALKFSIDHAQMTRLHYYADGEFSLQSIGKYSHE